MASPIDAEHLLEATENPRRLRQYLYGVIAGAALVAGLLGFAYATFAQADDVHAVELHATDKVHAVETRATLLETRATATETKQAALGAELDYIHDDLHAIRAQETENARAIGARVVAPAAHR